MGTTTTTTRSSAFAGLLTLQTLLAIALGLLGFWQRPQPVDPTTLDLEHAAEVLDLERARLGELSGDLEEDRRSSTSGLVSLQVQAAGLQTLGLSWSAGEREGPLQAITLDVRFSGDPRNTPILAHGIYKQALALRVDALELTFVEPDFVLGTLSLRFWASVDLELDALPPVEGLDPELARLAAEVAVLESAQAALDLHRRGASENRRWLTQSLPALVLSGTDGRLARDEQ